MPKKIVYLSRDPFAREDFIKQYSDHGACDWCGQTRKLYQYGHETDSGRKSWTRGEFCSKSCWKAYHGV